jgi:NitT/TauT family transport system substrate-binding protein
MTSLLRLAAGIALSAAFAAPVSAAESNQFRVGRQPGLVYLQAIIMEEKKLIEKHAAALGLPDLKVGYSIITSGGVMTEAILSDSIDMAIPASPTCCWCGAKPTGRSRSCPAWPACRSAC